MLAFFLSLVFVDLAGYWLHRWAHVKGSPFYRPHMVHHVRVYPPRRFLSESYETSGGGNLLLWFGPVLVLYVSLLWLLLPWPMALTGTVGGVIPGIVSSLVHDATHIRGSWVWRRLGPLAEMHEVHHRRMRTNLGIVHFGWDRVFGTWRSPARAGGTRARDDR